LARSAYLCAPEGLPTSTRVLSGYGDTLEP